MSRCRNTSVSLAATFSSVVSRCSVATPTSVSMAMVTVVLGGSALVLRRVGGVAVNQAAKASS
jgi:hypothetical protein